MSLYQPVKYTNKYEIMKRTCSISTGGVSLAVTGCLMTTH